MITLTYNQTATMIEEKEYKDLKEDDFKALIWGAMQRLILADETGREITGVTHERK
jgi:hypothetical protein